MNFTTMFIVTFLASFSAVEFAVWLEERLAKKRSRHEKNS